MNGFSYIKKLLKYFSITVKMNQLHPLAANFSLIKSKS